MDEDDRKQLEENMRNLLDKQHNLNELIQKQNSVVYSSTNLLKKTTEDISDNFKNILTRIENMTEVIKASCYVYKESINFFMITKLKSLIEEG